MLAINADGKEKEEDDDGGDSALQLCLCTIFLKHVCSRETGLVMTDSQELKRPNRRHRQSQSQFSWLN